MDNATMKKMLAALACLAPVAAVASLDAVAPVSRPGSSANPGVVFQMEVKQVGSSDPAQTITASIEGPLLKIEVPGAGGTPASAMVFRSEQKEMVFIDHGSRSYTVMDEATMKEMVSQIGAAMGQMQEMMKNMPPEQRAKMEEVMKGRGMGPGMGAPPAPTELRRTSETAEHSGFPTMKYEGVQNGRVVREMWVTDWNNIDGFAEARPAFEGMAAFMQEMVRALSQTGFAAQLDLDIYNHMREAAGYPVLAIEFDENGQPQTESRLLSVTEQSIAASAFEPPDGYTRRAMGGAGS